MTGCTCPRCRLGYYPGSYTFGGYVPPQSSLDAVKQAIKDGLRKTEMIESRARQMLREVADEMYAKKKAK